MKNVMKKGKDCFSLPPKVKNTIVGKIQRKVLKRDLYKKENLLRYYISIDIVQADFNSLKVLII
jgi:hypothetical protein